MNQMQMIRSVQIDWDKIDEGSYLRNIEAIRDVDQIDFHHSVTFFAGENGSGKSTLLEAIATAYGFNPEGGTRNYQFSTYDSHSELFRAVKLIRSSRYTGMGFFLRAESFYNVATKEAEYSRDLPEYKQKKYHEKSHGESFLYLVQSSFDGSGLYLLDEPEAALSPQRQMTLLIEIDRCVKQGAQFIIVTHSPILLSLPGAEILGFDEGRLHPITYEETAAYRITGMFIRNREKMLKMLLEDNDEE